MPSLQTSSILGIFRGLGFFAIEHVAVRQKMLGEEGLVVKQV